MKLKARICAKKKILVSDPQLKSMTKTRWLFEGWQVRLEEEAKAKLVMQIGEEAVKAFQHVLCTVLGTNIEPIAEPDPENPSEPKYRWPKEGEFTPLIFAIARSDYIAAAMEKVGKIMPEVVNEASGDAPEPIVSEEDLEFFDDLEVDQRKAFWNSLEMQQQLKQLVIQEDPDKVDPRTSEHLRPKGLSDADKAALARHRTETMPAKMRFEVDADDDFADFNDRMP